MSDKDKVFIFDTTMRDGEQSPGASMSLEEKIQIWSSRLAIAQAWFAYAIIALAHWNRSNY